MARIYRLSVRALVVVAVAASIISAGWLVVSSTVRADQAVGCRNSNQVVGGTDRAEILDLIARYGPYFDYHEGEAWASLFTEDGEFDFPTIGDPTGSRTSIKGRERLAAFASRNSTGNVVVAHFSGTTILVAVGTRRVNALTPVGTVPVKTDAQFAATFNGLGVYIDDIVKTAEGWRFQKRTADIYGSFPMPGLFLPCE